jgi:hypothetical protein
VGLDNFLILPIRMGKRFDQVGVSVILKPLPALSVDGWEDLVPEAHSRELADLVQTIFHELQVISGVGEMGEVGRSHPEVMQVASAAIASCSAALEALAQIDDDFTRLVVQVAAEVIRRVEQEGERSGEETFAAALVRGLLGEQTEESTAIGVLTLCALEWPINEPGVREVLDI